MVKPSHAQQLNSFSDAELATAIQIHSRGELGLIGGIGPRKLFPMSKQIAKRFAANRIFLVGESAHVIPPIGAQGLNLSLRDAAHAVETALAAADDPGGDQALRDYEALRRQDILPRAAAVDAMNQSILLDLLPIHALRAGGLSAVSAIPYLRRLVMSAGIGESTQLPFAMHG
jgi:2-octaprenyl-6-methoxyphenol hydroxylase